MQVLKKLSLMSLGWLILGLGIEVNAQGPKPADAALEQRVLSQIHDINLTEIAAGKLATTQGQRDGVKTYGQHLVDDHQKADGKVMGLVKQEKLDLAKAKDDPDVQKGAAANKKALNDLRALSGAEFDKTFLAAMVDGHLKAIKMAKDAYDQTTDESFKTFLGKLLPELQHHEDMANELVKSASSKP